MSITLYRQHRPVRYFAQSLTSPAAGPMVTQPGGACAASPLVSWLAALPPPAGGYPAGTAGPGPAQHR
jgi:hypothetical protein